MIYRLFEGRFLPLETFGGIPTYLYIYTVHIMYGEDPRDVAGDFYAP